MKSEQEKYKPKNVRFRESDSKDEAFLNNEQDFIGPNRHGEQFVHHDSFQDDQFKNNYDPTYEDESGMKHPYEHGGELNRWSDDIRSESSHENHRSKETSMQKSNENEKRKLRLVEKYDSDDYSRIAGPDFTEEPFEIGESKNIEKRSEANWSHPGVSGKTNDGEVYVNNKELKEQKSFIGLGPKGYSRSDDRIYEEVCEALMRHKEIDASNIGVKVEKGTVYLSGKVLDRRMKKLSETVSEAQPGVKDVRNELTIISGVEENKGPDSATKKDLGLI